MRLLGVHVVYVKYQTLMMQVLPFTSYPSDAALDVTLLKLKRRSDFCGDIVAIAMS